jgi:hypothetical protein
MKTIIVINDNSVEAIHAAKLALLIAEKVKANLLIANESKILASITVDASIAAGDGTTLSLSIEPSTSIIEELDSFESLTSNFKPDISGMDISDFCVDDLAKLIIKTNIWMIVKGAREFGDNNLGDLHINMQYVLNKVMCPLLLVPSKFKIRDFERLVYLADLRYCRLQVIRYLVELAKPFGASVQIDHLSAKNLPHMEQNYAARFFNEEFKSNINYDRLFFDNIRERDIYKAVDVMIKGMHIDLLAVVNHRFHFEEIFGRYIPQVLPEQITIPLLIFPY